MSPVRKSAEAACDLARAGSERDGTGTFVTDTTQPSQKRRRS